MDHRVLIVFLLLWSSGLCGDTHRSVLSGDVRLVGGASRCDGKLEMKLQGEWKAVYKPQTEDRPVLSTYDVHGGRVKVDYQYEWDPTSAAEVCKQLNCELSSSKVEITCSGRLEVKINQSNQSWSSVCEDDFDQQDAEVVCRELGCGSPSVLQGVLYGDVEAPMWTREFQCGGHESALLDCRSSVRNTCSSGKAVGLTCSEPGGVRLVGGARRCNGTLEMKQQGEWKPVDEREWDLRLAGIVCGELDCGSAVSTRRRWTNTAGEFWTIKSDCDASSLMECFTGLEYSSTFLEITCSDSQTIRLVKGSSLCSGRLEVKINQSNQSWSSVCEDDFDQQDAEVVCRELGCGAPSVPQGALYGDVEAPMWTREFQCGGNESFLLDCRSSASTRETCSPVGLTCADPDIIRLVKDPSRCAGILEVKNHGEWRPVNDWDSEWDQMPDAMCRQLDCGSAVSTVSLESYFHRPVWWINSSCVQSKSALKECVSAKDAFGSSSISIICSGLLAQPVISPSPSTDGVSQAKQQGLQVLLGSEVTIRCSIEPQYQGGSFQLLFSSSNTAQNYTLPAVNHSAHFLFPAADPTHQGEYRCVYHLHFYSHNFSSESQPLHLTVSASLTELIIRCVVLLLGMTILIAAVCFTSKASRKVGTREDL
ncbi:scavenger receptor cysteine-rich type 1 protein M130-like [Anoplopoma fimbria]|uniref:scavenger receptor cysteine-rich type 1 protein M130-like n=1 Tax=Anoplopoma fimbria TaxID=229290 RepID=UPI0023ED11F9|nr:scavenger receptor cysteine-rich type 1 protein M130-like [Anoplopoma fimbria]